MSTAQTSAFAQSLNKLNATGKAADAVDAAIRFIEAGEGDPPVLAGRLPSDWHVAVRRVLGNPAGTTEEDRRAIALLAKLNEKDSLGTWIDKFIVDEPEGGNIHTLAADLLRQVGLSDSEIAILTVRNVTANFDGRLNSAGRYLLALNNDQYAAIVGAGMAAAERASRLLHRFGGPEHGSAAAALAFVAADDSTGAEVAAAFASADIDPEKYYGHMLAGLQLALAQGEYRVVNLSRRAVYLLGARTVPAFIEYMKTPPPVAWQSNLRVMVLEAIASELKNDAAPILWAAAEHAELPVRLVALEFLIKNTDPAATERIEQALLSGLADPKKAAKLIPLAGRRASPGMIARLWELALQKHKPSRAAAAKELATADPNAVERAAGLAGDPSKDVRLSAALVLSAVGTPAAAEHLLNRLGEENVDAIRDELFRGLLAAGTAVQAIADRLGPLDWEDLQKRAAGAKAPAPWIGDGLLTPLRTTDGKTLESDLVRYLLDRQSRQTDPAPHPEALRLYALIDRQRSGDFAKALLDAYLDSGRGKPDAWALIVAGMLGDNRVVTTLAAQCRRWADTGDQKLGTWGIEALALNGSDAALMAIDSIARKFRDSTRRKQAVVGEAAQEAIEKTAKRLGLSLDQLGDQIVPTLGFDPGRPRLIEAGKKTIEATIGLDFKLAMKDVATGKRAVSIPKAAAPETQAEFKGLGKLLQDVAKSQTSRLEALMVRQHRWTGKRWRELFLQHPLLFPFAVRLVWAAYDATGKVSATFRALPDRTLTDPEDESVDPPGDEAMVGIAHPLELSAEQIDAWRTHLGDYEIEPPFEQMERRVVHCPDALREATSYDALKAASLNAFSFRGKAERAGWNRGASGDGGMIDAYRKRFPALGIDAHVSLDGLPAWSDPSAIVTLQQVYFLSADVKREWVVENRWRLGDVPVMAFSEAIGDLHRITGRGD